MHDGGKIEVLARMPVADRDDLSRACTPGVARVCQAIAAQPERVHDLTIKKNTVAIVTDGTAVLGLGDIGPGAAMRCRPRRRLRPPPRRRPPRSERRARSSHATVIALR